jgi:hypothetical protein
MAKNGLLNAVMWIVGVLVSLAVGFGMTSLTLSIPYIPDIIVQIAGWIVVIGTVIGVILALTEAAK